jgi:biotin carboxylase
MSVKTDDGPLLIIAGSSYAKFRRYIFESISAEYRLWLLAEDEPTWENDYIESFSAVDCADADKLTAAVREVAERHEVAGVFCYDERYVLPAAQAGAAMGFRSADPAAIARCRDKSATRTALRAAGLRQPASRAVATLAEASAAAAEMGYPVVLKPRNLAGSVGVCKVSGPEELAERYEATSGARLPGVQPLDRRVIVEEYVEGPEVAVDSVFFDGHCQPIVAARKLLGDKPPFEFDEHGHDIDADDSLLSDPELIEVLRAAHAAVGFRNGVTHTEFKLTPSGPCVIEINARMGGDLIPYLGQLASGYDEALAAADVAAGRQPRPVVPTRHRAACIRFAVAPHDMEVTAAHVRDDLVRPPVHAATLTVHPGRMLHLPPKGIARFGYVITVADTLAEARAGVLDPARFFDVSGTPLTTTPGVVSGGEAS